MDPLEDKINPHLERDRLQAAKAAGPTNYEAMLTSYTPRIEALAGKLRSPCCAEACKAATQLRILATLGIPHAQKVLDENSLY